MVNYYIKRIVIATIVLFVFSLNLNAQKTFGIKGGINFSDFYDHSESETVSGLSVGLFNDIQVYDELFFSVGLLYSEEGSNFRGIGQYGTLNSYSVYVEVHRGYVEFPVNLGYKIKLNDDVSCKPYLGFIYTIVYWTEFSKTTQHKDLGPPDPDTEYDFVATNKNMPTNQKGGFSLGLELEYKNAVVFDLRYSRFFDPIETASTLAGIDYRVHLLNFSFGVYIF